MRAFGVELRPKCLNRDWSDLEWRRAGSPGRGNPNGKETEGDDADDGDESGRAPDGDGSASHRDATSCGAPGAERRWRMIQ